MIAPSDNPPGKRWRAIAAMPAEAMQPQLEQSGFPPNWHGVMAFFRSAETQRVILANVHSLGEAGGAAYAASTPSGM